ncbi:maleylpyruvate isomerase family mycothiol-dependent enzyme [Streptomyces niveus]|uniref:maleylpyruvate isomerase family mycothiol-dependent enzyme n=1 Tax=Streptomyces niveus TaxID=193462 RepID=UPI003421F67F
MPPAMKRKPRGYDYDKTRTAVLTQFAHVRAAVLALTPEQLALPAGLGDWTVRELAAHLCFGAESVGRALEQPAPPAVEVGLPEWAFATAAYAAPISDDVKAYAASAEPAELFARTADRITELLSDAPADRLIAIRVGAMRLGDFLVTRTVELVVHTDDLHRATGLGIPFDRQALAACTRLLADALAAKAPGASTEVRIPPYAVVQCVEGPRHTRGTPPNVVETDPVTWLRLATGRTTWAEALASAQVSASGERADLAALLPVMS